MHSEVIYYARCERCKQAKNRTLSPLCGLCRQEVKREAAVARKDRSELALARATAGMMDDEREAVRRLLKRTDLRDAVSFVKMEVDCTERCCRKMTREERLEAIQ